MSDWAEYFPGLPFRSGGYHRSFFETALLRPSGGGALAAGQWVSWPLVQSVHVLEEGLADVDPTFFLLFVGLLSTPLWSGAQ